MLINWFMSSCLDSQSINESINKNDLKLITLQFCTNLLVAGVLRQCEQNKCEENVIFRVIIMKINILQ
jgi:formin 2